jgi:hypothetical protein
MQAGLVVELPAGGTAMVEVHQKPSEQTGT